MNIKHFFDPDTFTLTYIVFDEKTKDAVIIDPVLDFDPPSGKVTDKNTRTYVNFINDNSLKLHAVLETHAHADHLSSSQIFKKIWPEIKIGISENIKVVQATFKEVFELEGFEPDGHQFDLLFKANQEVQFGSLKMKAIPTPGHTPACMSYLIEDSLFSGDAIFMPDYGTGRCDFPKGSAKDLYQSISKNIYSLSDETKIYVGHDYLPQGRELRFMTTVGESKRQNIQLKATTNEADFIRFREDRDATLKAPRLLLPSIQVNIDAGKLPTFLKLPLSISFPEVYVLNNVPTLKLKTPKDIDGLQLIDVRRDDEFISELGHIKRAMLHTLGDNLQKFLEKADKNRPTLFICRSGARSAAATLLAKEYGFKEAYNMEGGMIKWNELGFPVER